MLTTERAWRVGLLFTFAGNEGHLQTMPKPTKPLLQRQDLECRRSGDGAGIRQAETLADQPPHTRIRGRRRAFGGRLHAHRTAEPPQDEDIPIATFEILDGQHLGAVDRCGVRAPDLQPGDVTRDHLVPGLQDRRPVVRDPSTIRWSAPAASAMLGVVDDRHKPIVSGHLGHRAPCPLPPRQVRWSDGRLSAWPQSW